MVILLYINTRRADVYILYKFSCDGVKKNNKRNAWIVKYLLLKRRHRCRLFSLKVVLNSNMYLLSISTHFFHYWLMVI